MSDDATLYPATRRIKRIELFGRALLSLMKGDARVSSQGEQIPADAKLVMVGGDSNIYYAGGSLNACWMAVESESFPEVEEGAIIPRLEVVFELIRWTCERACGYEGNLMSSSVCEVCKRGRGD